jgi:hypothetical protein
MINNSNGLTKLINSERSGRYGEEWNFSEGDVRKAFQKIFSPKETYLLFKTVANPKAVEVLEQYIGFRKDMGFPWNIRKIKNGDNPEYVPGATDNGNGLQFDNSLMDSYLGAIDELANKTIGNNNFAHYSMVSTIGVHNLQRDSNAIFWPRIYVVKNKKQNQLKKIIDELAGDESFKLLKKQESGSAYQMGEIETLHNLKIQPLLRLEPELVVKAQDLLRYVDFLAQMKQIYHCR